MSTPLYPYGSLLADVLISVRDQFAAAPGMTTAVLCGETHLASEESAGDRIVFVTGDGDPEMAPVRIGQVIGQAPAVPHAGAQGFARVNHECDAYVWGANDTDIGDDPAGFLRAQQADVTLRNLLVALYTAAPGMIALKKITKGTNANVLSYGAEYIVRFTFLFQINQVPLATSLPVKSNLAMQINGQPETH